MGSYSHTAYSLVPTSTLPMSGDSTVKREHAENVLGPLHMLVATQPRNSYSKCGYKIENESVGCLVMYIQLMQYGFCMVIFIQCTAVQTTKSTQ
jgi:hypothetical protein